MLALVVLSMVRPQAAEVSEYFPLVPGTTWTYQDAGAGSADTYVDSVGNEQEVGGLKARPIVTKLGKSIVSFTFYRIEGNQVLMVAFDQNKPFDAPYPVLKLEDGRGKWEYKGTTEMMGAKVPMTLKGSTRRSGSREWFGAKRDQIEVTMDAEVGGGDKAMMQSHQVATYAKGIGLVLLKDTTTINKTKTTRTRTLIAFKAGEGS